MYWTSFNYATFNIYGHIVAAHFTDGGKPGVLEEFRQTLILSNHGRKHDIIPERLNSEDPVQPLFLQKSEKKNET